MEQFKWEYIKSEHGSGFVGQVLKIPFGSWINIYEAEIQESTYNKDPKNYNSDIGYLIVIR